jgi:hypothetical protein
VVMGVSSITGEMILGYLLDSHRKAAGIPMLGYGCCDRNTTALVPLGDSRRVQWWKDGKRGYAWVETEVVRGFPYQSGSEYQESALLTAVSMQLLACAKTSRAFPRGKLK